MSIKDLEPEGFIDAFRTYARITNPADMYVQGMDHTHVAVWLRIRGGTDTMIGYGDPDEALSEAEEWAKAQLQQVRKSIEERKKASKPEPETVTLNLDAPCRNALKRDGECYPKSNCQRCGTLMRPGWKCAEGLP